VVGFYSTIAKYRGILYYRTLASLRADARGLYLGYIWWLLEPVLNAALYYLVFGVLMGSKSPGLIAYILVGTVVYQWFQGAVNGSINTLAGRSAIYRQIPLPKYLFALIAVFSNTWKFFCVLIVVAIYLQISIGVQVGAQLLYLPLLFFVQLNLIFSFVLVLCLAASYMKDIQSVTNVVFRGLMFLSAIFWRVEKVPEHLLVYFYSNPIACLIQGYRNVLMYGNTPNLFHIAYVFAFSFVLMQLGLMWHKKVDGHVLKHLQT